MVSEIMPYGNEGTLGIDSDCEDSIGNISIESKWINHLLDIFLIYVSIFLLRIYLKRLAKLVKVKSSLGIFVG